MANKVGALIKKARTDAGFTQEQLAKKVPGITASDISKAERGEKELTQTALKQIAKVTGVTQTALLEAAKKSTYGTAKPAAKTSSAKASPFTSSKTSMQVTATEKKLVLLYREADPATKKAVVRMLKGETDSAGEIIASLLDSAVDLFMK